MSYESFGTLTVRRIALNLPGETFDVTVLMTDDGEAYCTCLTFVRGDFSHKWKYPQMYFGATVDHGCQHVDYVMERYTTPRQAVPRQAVGQQRGDGDLVDLLAKTFKSGVELGMTSKPLWGVLG